MTPAWSGMSWQFQCTEGCRTGVAQLNQVISRSRPGCTNSIPIPQGLSGSTAMTPAASVISLLRKRPERLARPKLVIVLQFHSRPSYGIFG